MHTFELRSRRNLWKLWKHRFPAATSAQLAWLFPGHSSVDLSWIFGSQILPSSLESSKDFASSFRKVLPSSAPTSLHALKKMKLKRESNWVIKRRKASQKRFFMSNMEKRRGPHGWFCCCVTSSLFSESRAIILITSWQDCLYFPYRFLF